MTLDEAKNTITLSFTRKKDTKVKKASYEDFRNET